MIVGMSRDICVRLYDEIITLKPEWHDTDHRKGGIKVSNVAELVNKLKNEAKVI